MFREIQNDIKVKFHKHIDHELNICIQHHFLHIFYNHKKGRIQKLKKEYNMCV